MQNKRQLKNIDTAHIYTLSEEILLLSLFKVQYTHQLWRTKMNHMNQKSARNTKNLSTYPSLLKAIQASYYDFSGPYTG